MIELRPFSKLGSADYGWLKALYHFSFSNYFDPNRMAWGALRVWNDDEIAAGSGFPAHAHSDMEIITYIRQGAITHQDSLGNKGRTTAGDVQVMSAGTGVRHAEYNMENETTRLFQIWIMPRAEGGQPSWGTKPFPKSERSGQFALLASGFGEADALTIRADARIFAATLQTGETITHNVDPNRHQYMVASTGAVSINELQLNSRDGAAITGETSLRISCLQTSELVLVDTD